MTKEHFMYILKKVHKMKEVVQLVEVCTGADFFQDFLDHVISDGAGEDGLAFHSCNIFGGSIQSGAKTK